MSTLSSSLLEYKQLLSNGPVKEVLWEVIEGYFDACSIEQVKNELWLLTVGILTADNIPEVDNGLERNNRLFFYEHSLIFMDAVFLLYQEHDLKKSGNKAKSKKKKSKK